MGLINAIKETNEKAAEVGEKYLESSLKYYKLKFFKQLSVSATTALKIAIIGGLALLFLIFGAIALALHIGDSINSYPLGFLITGCAFLVLSIIAYLLKNNIDRLVIRKLSKKFFN
jgi:hypothetical protein